LLHRPLLNKGGKKDLYAGRNPTGTAWIRGRLLDDEIANDYVDRREGIMKTSTVFFRWRRLAGKAKQLQSSFCE